MSPSYSVRSAHRREIAAARPAGMMAAKNAHAASDPAATVRAKVDSFAARTALTFGSRTFSAPPRLALSPTVSDDRPSCWEACCWSVGRAVGGLTSVLMRSDVTRLASMDDVVVAQADRPTRRAKDRFWYHRAG